MVLENDRWCLLSERGLSWGGGGWGHSLHLHGMKEGFRHEGLKRGVILDQGFVSMETARGSFQRSGVIKRQRSFMGGGGGGKGGGHCIYLQ